MISTENENYILATITKSTYGNNQSSTISLKNGENLNAG